MTISDADDGDNNKIKNYGTVEVEVGGKIVIATNGITHYSGYTPVINNYGTIEIKSLTNYNGTVTNYAGATLSVSGTLSGGGGKIDNYGTIEAADGSLTTAGGTITNSGTISAGTVTTDSGTITNSGVLCVTGAIETKAGTITVADGGVLFANSTITNGDDDSNSSGTFNIYSGGILYANGAITNTVDKGTFNNSGTIYYNTSTTLPTDIGGTDGTETAATFYDDSDSLTTNSLTSGSTHVIIGNVTVSSSITNSGTLVIAPSGTLTVASGYKLTIDSTGTLTNYGSVVGDGSIKVESDASVTGVDDITDAATYTWESDTWTTKTAD